MIDKDYSQKNLGKRIRHYREFNNWTVKTLADKADMSPSYVSNLENGSGNSASFETVYKLAHALSVRIDDLLVDSLNKYADTQNTGIKKEIANELSTCSDMEIDFIYDIVVQIVSNNRAREADRKKNQE